MHLQQASLADIITIRRLAESIWLAHYPQIIGMEQTQYMLQKMYSAQRLSQQLTDGLDFWLVMEQEQPIGFVATKQVTENEAFIDKFYLDTNQQSTGLGSGALALLLEKLPITTQNIQLQVNRQNYKSINFYFKNGFKIASCMDVEIGNGYAMNDFLMVRRLNG
jgi:diamine N-acetyltransferase